MSRAQTLILALLFVHLLLGALSVAAARGQREPSALRLWGWGLLVYAAGLGVILARDLSPALTAFVGNTLVTLSAVVTTAGVLRHAGRRVPLPWAGAGVTATVAALAAGNFTGVPHAAINLIAPTVFAAAIFAWAAAGLYRHPPADAERAARFVAIALGCAVAVWLARIGAAYAAAGDRAQLDAVVSFFAIAQVLTGVAATFGLFWIEVQIVQSALARVAFSDSLTGLPNRRATVARFEEEAARALRARAKFAIAVFDIDHFKQVNDEHGHLAGDAVLRHVARLFGAGKRTEDGLGRIGGEEFVVIMTGPQAEGAEAAAERLRRMVEATPFMFDRHAHRVTVSGGVAHYPDDGMDWDHLFGVADARMYEAKRAGRNRIIGRVATA